MERRLDRGLAGRARSDSMNFRGCFFLAVSGLLAVSPSTEAAVLSCRVIDAQTKLALAGARVSIPGTNLETFADQAGNYTLNEVPAGSQTVEFSYIGYPNLKQ